MANLLSYARNAAKKTTREYGEKRYLVKQEKSTAGTPRLRLIYFLKKFGACADNSHDGV
jgi:hypothetical protein